MFYAFFRGFGVKTDNHFRLGVAAFITQLVTWAAVLVSPVDFGMLGTNKAFPGRADGLHPEMAYSGCEDSFAFQAGSYMYYSKWRNQLAEMAGLGSAEAVRTNPEKEGLPFVELINFSDCEGVIGPK